MGQFAADLAETSMVWRKAVAPYAEEVAKMFWQGRSKSAKFNFPATRLTQARRSLAKAGNLVSRTPTIPKPQTRCQRCGESVTTGSMYCLKCVPAINRERLIETARLGRIATHTPIAEARRLATHMKQVEAQRKWNSSELPSGPDEDFYRREILPRLVEFTVKKIRVAIDVSHPYATLIRRGDRIPHPRHWVRLAGLAGVSVELPPAEH